MEPLPHKIRPPMKTFGGKYYLARRIIRLFPEHRVYIEPFVGGGSVLLNKPLSTYEILADRSPEIIDLWRSIRKHASSMSKTLAEIPYSKESWELYSDPDCRFEEAAVEEAGDIEPWHEACVRVRARAFRMLILSRMSRGGLGKTFAWSDRQRGGRPGDENAWLTFILAGIFEVQKRIEKAFFNEADFRDTLSLKAANCSDTLIYCDPPYLPETRTAKNVYAHEMTFDDHYDLLELLTATKAKVFLSGYRNGLYDTKLAGWTRHDWDMPNHSGQGKTKQRRIESIWENHP